jgi:hypothetical protein
LPLPLRAICGSYSGATRDACPSSRLSHKPRLIALYCGFSQRGDLARRQISRGRSSIAARRPYRRLVGRRAMRDWRFSRGRTFVRQPPSNAGVSGHHQQTLAFARLQRSLRAGRKLRAVRMRTRNAPGIALRPKSRRENPIAICVDHRDAARDAGSPIARDRRLENPLALGVEHRVNAGDRSGRHVRELSFSDLSAQQPRRDAGRATAPWAS